MTPITPKDKFMDLMLSMSLDCRMGKLDFKTWLDNTEFYVKHMREKMECPNCFEGKSDMEHTCRKCDGTGIQTDVDDYFGGQ